MDLMKRYQFHIVGATPLLMHACTLADPLHPLKKKMSQITAIRKKQDEHYLAIAKLEWEAGLYFDDNLGLYMPCKNIVSSIGDAAKKQKRGKDIKAVMFDHPVGFPIIGFEHKSIEDIWNIKDKKDRHVHVHTESVKVMKARVMRTRPVFPKWELKGEVLLDTEIMAYDEFKHFFEQSGAYFGLGDWRPGISSGHYGKFNLMYLDEV